METGQCHCTEGPLPAGFGLIGLSLIGQSPELQKRAGRSTCVVPFIARLGKGSQGGVAGHGCVGLPGPL